MPGRAIQGDRTQLQVRHLPDLPLGHVVVAGYELLQHNHVRERNAPTLRGRRGYELGKAAAAEYTPRPKQTDGDARVQSDTGRLQHDVDEHPRSTGRRCDRHCEAP